MSLFKRIGCVNKDVDLSKTFQYLKHFYSQGQKILNHPDHSQRWEFFNQPYEALACYALYSNKGLFQRIIQSEVMVEAKDIRKLFQLPDQVFDLIFASGKSVRIATDAIKGILENNEEVLYLPMLQAEPEVEKTYNFNSGSSSSRSCEILI